MRVRKRNCSYTVYIHRKSENFDIAGRCTRCEKLEFRYRILCVSGVPYVVECQQILLYIDLEQFLNFSDVYLIAGVDYTVKCTRIRIRAATVTG